MKKINYYFISRHYVKNKKAGLFTDEVKCFFSFSLPCGISDFSESALLSMA